MNPALRPDPALILEHGVAVAAAEEAGRLLRGGFQGELGVRPKGEGGADVVTDLDLMAEQLILARLREHFPQDRVIAEESGVLEGARAAGGPDAAPRRTWLVDPLDGSNNVAIGLAAYVVGIALCAGADPVLGVIHDPVTARTWTARRGGGAHGPHGRMKRPDAVPPAAGPLIAWTQGHAVPRADPVARALKSSLELHARRVLQLWAPLLCWSMLARGDIDGFVGYRAEAVDLPAGSLLAAEAGVEIRRLDGSPFNQRIGGPDTDRSFVAASGDLMPRLLDLVAEAPAAAG